MEILVNMVGGLGQIDELATSPHVQCAVIRATTPSPGGILTGGGIVSLLVVIVGCKGSGNVALVGIGRIKVAGRLA